MKEEMLPVRVSGVALPSEDSMPVVVLSGDGGRVSVSVGAYEAGAIIMQIEGLSTPRPLTHQLLARIFRDQGLELVRVEIYGVYGFEEDGFLARIVYGKGFRRKVMDVRPSDAIALALALGAPLYAHASLLSPSIPDIPEDSSYMETELFYRPGQTAEA